MRSSRLVGWIRSIAPLLTDVLQNIIPFAVVGSEKSIIVDGKQVRGRQNRWGVINGKQPNYVKTLLLGI